MPDELQRFAANFTPPDHGRYVNTPVRADQYGILYVPPAPPDPVPMYAAGVGLAAAAGLSCSPPTRRKKDQHRRTRSQAIRKYRRDGYRD